MGYIKVDYLRSYKNIYDQSWVSNRIKVSFCAPEEKHLKLPLPKYLSFNGFRTKKEATTNWLKLPGQKTWYLVKAKSVTLFSKSPKYLSIKKKSASCALSFDFLKYWEHSRKYVLNAALKSKYIWRGLLRKPVKFETGIVFFSVIQKFRSFSLRLILTHVLH